MTRSEVARTALLDAAERLFAENGISGVSDRSVAEAAGQKNHSAVAYYFGGREGLLVALVQRHASALDAHRPPAPGESLEDDVRGLVLPATAVLAGLPVPSWRARFIARALHHQHTMTLVRDDLDLTPATEDLARSVVRRLSDLDSEIVSARVRLLFQVVWTTCADVERRSDESGENPAWDSVGNFLADALTGMLQAPITA